jgi:hypothetical protein
MQSLVWLQISAEEVLLLFESSVGCEKPSGLVKPSCSTTCRGWPDFELMVRVYKLNGRCINLTDSRALPTKSTEDVGLVGLL